MEREPLDANDAILLKMSERNHHVELRHYYESEIVRQDNIIRLLGIEIEAMKRPQPAGETPLDIPPLHQSLQEIFVDKLLRALDRLPR